ncbi:MAG: CDP-alcohol phosphatidyltransferase family protein [Gammaproteobacteria bacterium]
MRARDIPNLLCVLRIVLTVPIAWAIIDGRYPLALVLFFVAGVTDGLDGFLAKRFSWQSRLGGLLDPAADKLLLVTAFVTLWWAGYVPSWLLAAVVARDLLIVTGAGLYLRRVGSFEAEPSIISKVNSFLQLLYVLFILSWLVFGVPSLDIVAVMGWMVLMTTVGSGFDYWRNWNGRVRGARA